ncbi:MAG: thiamine pyrophosphate-binding protein [Deltaproteobacteria bacterium]|jgi:acetolactate synthase I/II/III large subunit|nr:thiamine pyrophosphate-binding protein [Deltaproteobacteria bacterium]MBT4090891.1 thiamine pyrophosphate-binding protein [Deltaproteobacteria bacterium]MBT4268154.1 thiamine pyrophosphate-binding protein [Deltaproteobacteria bacterium]MBT4640217.1 thiamine pyrophosphate-binding protein [Deltaproteobacteria bacterium]MBT6613621.1 thiamine pyrophosphate-binding protein [Deltaproteobacteria bacterium]
MKIRVADYLASMLYDAGGEDVFMVTGGMIMFLTDAVYQHDHMKHICCHHEQAAVMAAEAYGRYSNKLGVAYVTAGPAALNTLNSVVGALVDRSPCIVVAGQSKVSQARVTTPRQFALQGFNTLPIFEKVTKYAVMLDDIATVKYSMEKAIHTAKSHPVGPVWIECPIDIQAATFDPDDYDGFSPEEDTSSQIEIKDKFSLVNEAIRNAKRPCILAGPGVRLAGAVESFNRIVQKLNIPVLTSRLGMDLMGHHNPLFIGRPGTYGDRPANFTIQNSDLLLTIGCRLSIGLIGHDYQDFAPNAKKIMVDIDEKELTKPSVSPDIPVQADAKDFIEALDTELDDFRFSNGDWLEKTKAWKSKYPVNLPEYKNEKEGINSYHFINVLSEKSSDDDVFLLDTGSCFHVHSQAFKVKYGQRHIITGGLSTMGYMPGVIGPAVLRKEKDVYCITGDGSLQMNIQELQTIATNNLPVKIVVLNNNGYLLIRLTQQNFCEGRLIGEGPESGVGFPNLEKLADLYGLGYMKIASIEDLDDKADDLVNASGPLICEVITPAQQLLIPRVASKKLDDGSMISMPYDDMFPFLDRDEYLSTKCE